ncbi:hypothetical protein H8L32_10485 [Undibacterium sp. CY18W]|uniref:Uncharacterized protein n=1 Tax=Undibacterium hunanense TaxID=2762292 RepID=A0ABR6ZPT9_9BURK|nr:hypothetical protein [Undibacterium hunanense]MBC3917901.1 hypothetical protein [Undibacterium hunanense]
MSVHHISFIVCSLLMVAQYACAQEVKEPTGAGKIDSQSGNSSASPVATYTKLNTPGNDVAAVRKAEAGLVSAQPDLNESVVAPSPSDAQLAGTVSSTQSTNRQGMYARVTKEYYNQSANQSDKQEKAGALSRFGLRYSATDNDQLWMEYRISEKSALRLRGAAHRGIRVLAVFHY